MNTVPNKPEVTYGCSHFDKTEVADMNVLLSKDSNRVITNTRTLIIRCLGCKLFGDRCNDTNILYDYLEQNDRK